MKKKIFIVVCGFALVLALVELGLRFVNHLTGEPAPYVLQAYHSAVIPDAVLGYRLRPGWHNGAAERVNSRGYRGPEFTVPKPAGVYRIVIAGGSTTYGTGVADRDALPALLGAMLADSIPGVEVVNAGVPGYHSYHQRLRMPELLALQPDLVVYCSGWNDLGVALCLGPEWRAGTLRGAGILFDPASRPSWQRGLRRAAAYSALMDFARKCYFRHLWDAAREPAIAMAAEFAGNPVVAENYETNLRLTVAQARAAEVPVVIATLPFILRQATAAADSAALSRFDAGFVDRESRYWPPYLRWNGEMRKRQEVVTAAANVPLIDCAAAFDRFEPEDRRGLFLDMLHLSAEGNRAMAACLAEAIARRPLTVPGIRGRRR